MFARSAVPAVALISPGGGGRRKWLPKLSSPAIIDIISSVTRTGLLHQSVTNNGWSSEDRERTRSQETFVCGEGIWLDPEFDPEFEKGGFG